MHKHIILLDREGLLLTYILQHTNYNIAVLVCEFNKITNPIIKKYSHRIEHVLNYLDLLEVQHSTHIDYDIVKQMKPIQIDVETMLHRVMLNNPIAKDIYYQYLSFFTEIFQKYNINFVLNAEMILATPHHLIPFGLARLNKIPSYTLETINNDTAIFYFNQKLNIPFDPLDKPPSSIKNQCFYAYSTHVQIQNRSIKSYIYSLLYKLGGAMFVEFFVCLKNFNFKQQFMGLEYNYFSKLYSLFKHKQMHRYYKKHSVIPNLNENFIYFNLHLEPEAAIIGRALLEAQLTLIKMTAKALPKGWKLYVKEHPHQLLFNNNITDYFLHNITFFKNISFYKHIALIPNVKLVSLQLSSKELIESCRAIATFNGTVTIEAIRFQKPVILFDSLSSPYRILSHTLHIFSYKDLQEAIHKIENGFPYTLDEEKEFALLESYMANAGHKDFFKNLLTTISKHIAQIKKD